MTCSLFTTESPFCESIFFIIVYNNGICIQVELKLHKIHIRKTKRATGKKSVALFLNMLSARNNS